MVIEFPCWKCGKNLKSKQVHSGRKCKCTECDSINTIPGTKQDIEEDLTEDELEDEELEEEDDEAVEHQSLPELQPIVLRAQKPVNWLLRFGILMLVIGILMLGYYLLIFDPTDPETMYGYVVPHGDRIYNLGRMNHKMVGCIAGGIISIIGSILLAAGSLKKA